MPSQQVACSTYDTLRKHKQQHSWMRPPLLVRWPDSKRGHLPEDEREGAGKGLAICVGLHAFQHELRAARRRLHDGLQLLQEGITGCSSSSA